MIGFEEVQKERETKISTLKRDLNVIEKAHEALNLEHNSLKINNDKLDGQYTNLKRDNDDVVDKLHAMNKARYELETKVSDES